MPYTECKYTVSQISRRDKSRFRANSLFKDHNSCRTSETFAASKGTLFHHLPSLQLVWSACVAVLNSLPVFSLSADYIFLSFGIHEIEFNALLKNLLEAVISVAFESALEIMVLFVLHKLILQTRMRSHPVGLDVWFLVRPFVYFHTSCVRTAKALRGCAGSPEPSLVAYLTSTIISWAGSFVITAHEQTQFLVHSYLVWFPCCAPTGSHLQYLHDILLGRAIFNWFRLSFNEGLQLGHP